MSLLIVEHFVLNFSLVQKKLL